VDAVTRHGWSALWVAGSLDFAYTVGLWHTFGVPELVMFGLAGDDMPTWLNTCVQRCQDKGWPATEEPFDGVLEGFDTQLREVHPSWYRALFGTALGFYRGVAVPFRQLVWPDRHGRWPWDGEATPSSRARQAFSWQPVAQHREGAWRLIGELGPTFPFPVGPDAWVLTTRSVLDGSREVATVAYDQGSYDILDERGHAAEDLCLAFLGDVVRRHPRLSECADLTEGQTVSTSDRRTVAHITAADRRTSKRAWTLAEPV
jgi:hypothetical protein